MHIESYESGIENRLVAVRDASDNIIAAYDYDDAGRLQTADYFAADDGNNSVKTVTYSYDNSGRLTGWSDSQSGMTGAFTYDALGRKDSEAVNYGDNVGWVQPTGSTLTYSYAYFKDGRKKAITYPNTGVAPDNSTNNTYSFTYDAAGKLASIAIPDEGYITFPEYQWSRPKSALLPGGTQRQYGYDGLMRLNSIAVKDQAQVQNSQLGSLMQYGYGFDKMDNIVSKTTQDGAYGYSYDALYRLKNVGTPAETDNESFTYDPVGNRLSYNGSAEWDYSINNELSSTSDHIYQYDANGNTVVGWAVPTGATTPVEMHYTYDVDNRLIEVRDAGDNLIAQYAYDPFGRRLKKTVGWAAPTESTYYFYSDEGLIAEYDKDGLQQKTYGYKPGSTFTTDPQWMKQGRAYYYYQNDHLGTPQLLTTASGTVVWSAQYTAFGKAELTASGVENNLRFPGQYYDAETGLHYNYHRYYDPSTGRYVTADPIGLRGGDANLFAYVANDPINWLDPFGLWKCGKNSTCKPNDDMDKALKCLDKCAKNGGSKAEEVTVTGANGGHADLGRNSNCGLSRDIMEKCFKECFTKVNDKSYGQEEENDPKKYPGSTHFHLTTYPTKCGDTGFQEGVLPHKTDKCTK